MKHLRLMDEGDGDDPILSVVNLIDVFLVIIAALLLAVAQSPVNPFSAEQVTVIRNPGKDNMEIIVKDGQKLDHYRASGEIGEGQGAKAGVAYRLKDGSMVYVPESGAAGTQAVQ
ncbi:DUF2149 domain-containing protein [Diaphorobacter aerolatus]|uniref:DUF2149 domain-containing protein n=1 Tax=Diaphorobacter aerolatus TaxID=1288495 RepID=A0A7H0GGE1_9BURK|nr:DUF2149 domain-containing protein [Diaphorobacter aerolatus]QNP47357.1 DUF2149 domain-containing protein [Diaphorobacter aerolatus]